MSFAATPDPLTAAAEWRIRLAELGLDSTPDFEAWLSQPENAHAWAQISASWDVLGEAAHEPELMVRRQAALKEAHQAARERSWGLAWRRAAAGLVVAAGLGGAGWATYWWLDLPDDYRTARGETRVVTLSDGSRLSLDASTEVTVRYSQGARTLQLLRGQARFDVAHDVERPFSVLAGGQKVIATGTAFNIDLDGSQVLVTLIEGHVVVVDEKSNLPAVVRLGPALRHPAKELSAGQQLAAGNGPATVRPANLREVTAWTNGQLIVDNKPLSQVVAEVNRYASSPIAIRDAAVANMRISGVFNTSDIAGILDLITRYLPVRAAEQSDGSIVLEKERRS